MSIANLSLVKNRSDDFSDLEGDLDAEVTVANPAPSFLQASVDFARNSPALQACPNCRGSGRFNFRNGNVGRCFKCSGSGKVSAPRPKLMDDASVARRENDRVQRLEAKRQADSERLAAIAAFTVSHRDVLEYCGRVQNEFTANCLRQLATEGTMSDARIAAIRNAITRRVENATARVAAAPDVSGAGFEKVLESFKAARAKGLKRPKLTCGEFVFSYAGEDSKNPGHVYIKLGGNYKGKITPAGKFFGVREITSAETAEVARIGRDPLAAAIEHGRLTGACAICSRKLTDPKSVERGIGPICAENFGW